MTKKILTIIGTRPNFIKSTLVSKILAKNRIKEVVIHTGQHYDFELSQIFFDELRLECPDAFLKIESGNHGRQTGKMIIEIEKILSSIKPIAVIVYGDTNSTLAGALATAKIPLPLSHIEAGERSFNREAPEEINRIVCDHIATINCCATRRAVSLLKREGINKKVFFTGDIMLDLLLKYKHRAKLPNIKLPDCYIVATIHRAENTDNIEKLKKIILSLGSVEYPIIWPIHPRTQKAIEKNKIKLSKNIKTISPLSYFEMIALQTNSFRIITDSGGIQKEAYWLGIPCVTVLNETSWVQTLKGDWNQLVKDNPMSIKNKLQKIPKGSRDLKEFGDGDAAKNIFKIINDNFFK